MSLETGAKTTRGSWDDVPVPENVTKQVNVLGKDQLELFVFADRQGRQTGEVEIPGVDGQETQEASPNEHMENEIVEDDLGDLDPTDNRIKVELEATL